jgi:MFS family permease
MLGASNLWWVPLSQSFGRRVVLLLATLILTLTTMWCGLTTNFGSLLAARTIQGMGGGAADAVAPAAVEDMFFIHQRGRAMVSGFH